MNNNPGLFYLSCFVLYWLLLLQLPLAIYSQVRAPRSKDSLSLSFAYPPGSFACGSDMLLQQKRKNPVFVAKEKAMNNAIRLKSITSSGARIGAVDYTLPVVFHIISANPNSITDADVLTALQGMNDAFSASGTFAGGRTDTRIQFCLAKTDPQGAKTTGIVRTKSYLGDFDYDMEKDEMTALGRWDPTRYINIWIVEDIKSEYMQEFQCGVWTTLKLAGYASAGEDVIVAGLGVSTLCHEMGHYLSLLHTFGNRDCANSDCTTDGDLVCDTPPEKTITGGYPCANPQNSCNTDTLSGFTIDVPDLPDNFMDYGKGTGCILGFTEGQAARMRAFIAINLPGMISSTVCTEPCTDAIVASFTTNIDYPAIGDLLHLTNTSTGATSYKWLVDGTVMATTPNFDYTVTQKKNYTITLQAYGSTPGCFTSYYFVAEVSCGVVARFWPNRRVIASQQNVQLDSVLLTNRSIGATSYQWLASNDKGMAEQVVSTSFNFDYVFLQPANYKIRLVASNGTCSDTTNYVPIRVDDSSPDAGISIANVECYDQTKLKITFWFYNNGYKSVPKNTPVSFYNHNPNSATAQLVGSAYLLPYDVLGHCSTPLETYILDVGYNGLDSVFGVINDNGSTIPLALPNTGLAESGGYGNNMTYYYGFGFKVKPAVPDISVQSFQVANLSVLPLVGGNIASALWSTPTDLNCTSCIATQYTAPYRGDTAVTKKVIAYSNYGCFDSTSVNLHILPVDDYVISITSIECAAGGDSAYVGFSICNLYPKSDVPAGIKVAFYDANPTTANAHILGNVFVSPANSTDSCTSFTQIIKQSPSGTIYAVVNDNGTAIPVALPVTGGMPETNFKNNVGSGTYKAPTLLVIPSDTTVHRGDVVTLTYSTTMINTANPVWKPGNGYTLSCTSCASPGATVTDSSIVNMEITSRYGCKITASGKLNVYPPDMTIDILGNKCISNDSTQVSFRVCMHNGYTKIFQNIPVSFYDGKTGTQLFPVFHTSPVLTDSCAIFSFIVATPASDSLTAVVNDKGYGASPAHAYLESDYTNNSSTKAIIPFSASFNPSVIEVLRPGSTVLSPQITGGTATTYKWTWAESLSCYDCASPVATTRSTTQYQVKVKNEANCTDTAVITIKTFTNTIINIPNAFTPDGNGQNDIFYVIGTKSIKQVKDFEVFNRWGQRIFQTSNVPPNDKRYGWNGMYNGKTALPGTYAYSITIELEDGSMRSYKGVVLLIK